jgi:predicted ArsR family transcriptional regulator
LVTVAGTRGEKKSYIMERIVQILRDSPDPQTQTELSMQMGAVYKYWEVRRALDSLFMEGTIRRSRTSRGSGAPFVYRLTDSAANGYHVPADDDIVDAVVVDSDRGDVLAVDSAARVAFIQAGLSLRGDDVSDEFIATVLTLNDQADRLMRAWNL